jgi:hypothetical protein
MLRNLLLIAICCLIFVGGTVSALAQSSQTAQPKTEAQAASAETVPEDTADLSITANVTARELKFEVVPNPNVTFSGHPQRKTVWDAARQNLTRPVQPGVTYRNIGIQLKIVSVFADIDRIVAEALGEVPITDDLPSHENAAPQKAAEPAKPSPPTTTQPNSEGRPR